MSETPALSNRARSAALAYASAYSASKNPDPLHRRAALQVLNAARAHLTRQEVRIMDLAAGRGTQIGGPPPNTGLKPEDLWRAYTAACDKLVAHFGFSDPET